MEKYFVRYLRGESVHEWDSVTLATALRRAALVVSEGAIAADVFSHDGTYLNPTRVAQYDWRDR